MKGLVITKVGNQYMCQYEHPRVGKIEWFSTDKPKKADVSREIAKRVHKPVQSFAQSQENDNEV